MKKWNSSKSVMACGLAALAMFAGCASSEMPGVAAAPVPANAVKNVILVHGAWADGSSWNKVIPLLQQRGFHVVAVQMPLSNLADDAAVVKRAIALQDGPVILVGHSFGGEVITEAGNDPKVAGLVYVAAFAPDAGESAMDQAGPYKTPAGAEFRPDASGFLWMTPKGISEDFAQDLSPQERATMASTQGPLAASDFGAKVSTPAWKSKPSWYVVAGNDRTIAPEFERMISAKIKADTTEVPASHVAMLSHPVEVEAVIEKAAAGSR